MGELTKEEKQWVRKVQKALDACPSERLGFYTTGDSNLTIYDSTFDFEIGDIQDRSDSDFCNAVDKAGADLDTFLIFPSDVHSTAG